MDDGAVGWEFIGPELRAAEELLANAAFPPELAPLRTRSVFRMSWVYHSLGVLETDILADLARFRAELELHKINTVRLDPSVKLLQFAYPSSNCHTGLVAFVIAVKAMLDTLGDLVVAFILYPGPLTGSPKFKSKGANLVRWLSDHGGNFQNRDRLVSLLEQHISTWAKQLVCYRDKIVHFDLLPELTLMHLCIPLPIKPTTVDAIAQGINLPSIPGEGDLLDYCTRARDSLNSLVLETLDLLTQPGVSDAANL